MRQSYVANKNYKPSTAYGYQSLLNAHIIPGLGKKTLTQIRPEDLSAFFGRVREREVSNKTLLNLYNLLDLLFDLAVQCDWIQSSPVRPLIHRPEYKRCKKQALTPKQIAKVLEHVPTEHFPLFATIALTGLRLGEALAPRWLDVNFSARTLSVTHSLWRGQLVTPKTDGSEQTIHLSEELVRILLQHRQRSRWTAPGDFVFSREDGSPWDPDHLRKVVLRPAMDAAGINRGVGTHGFHIFRHSAGSIVYDRTRDMRLAQEVLRHTQIATTSDTYVHVDAAVAAEATETLAKAILPNYLISQTVAADLIVAATTDVIQ